MVLGNLYSVYRYVLSLWQSHIAWFFILFYFILFYFQEKAATAVDREKKLPDLGLCGCIFRFEKLRILDANYQRLCQLWQQGSASSFFTVYTVISKLCVHTTMQRPQTHGFLFLIFPLWFSHFDFLFFGFSIFWFAILDFPPPAFCRHQVWGLVTSHLMGNLKLQHH